MENEMRIQELAAILTQWDVVERCKKKMIKLLIGAYNNPMHLAESSLDKPSYREFPVRREIPHRKLIMSIIGVVSVVVILIAIWLRRTGFLVALGLPIGMLRWVLRSFDGSDAVYEEKCMEVDGYNWFVDKDYSKYISRTYDSLFAIHKQNIASGICALSVDEMHEFDTILDDNLKEKETLDDMLDDARVPSNYRKREYLAYVYNLLTRGKASSWEESFKLLSEVLRLNPNLV